MMSQPNSEACRNAEIARPETRSVCTRGALKSNEFYGSLSARQLLIRNATLQVGTFRALMRTPAASLCRGSIAGIRASDSPVLEKPLHCRDEDSTPLGLGGGHRTQSDFILQDRAQRSGYAAGRTPHKGRIIMERYVVYTPEAEYRDIFAFSATGAKWKVYRMTSGRCPMSKMTAVRTA